MLGDVLLLPHTDLTGTEIAVSYRFEGETADRNATVNLSEMCIRDRVCTSYLISPSGITAT